MTSRQLARALRRANARAETKQAKFERAARLAIRDLIRLAATRFEKHFTSLVAATGDPPGWVPPSTDELLSLDEVIGHYRGKTDPVRHAAINDFFDAFGNEVLRSDVKANFHVSNPLVAAEIEKTGSQITAVAETTRRNVRGIVSRAYQEGLSIDATAKAIREYATSISASRAILIARTEFVGLVQGGQLAATQIVADATGIPYLKVWRTAPGAEYPRHELYEGLEGQTVEINATFIVGSDLLKYPGDPDGDPGEVCNCRCSLDFVTQEERQAAIDAEQVAIPQDPLFTPSSEAQAISFPTSTIPTTNELDLSGPNASMLGDGGNVNAVFAVERGGETFVVKPVNEFAAQMRATIPAGEDIERETSAYTMARWIERLNPDLAVRTPELVRGTVTQGARSIYDDAIGDYREIPTGTVNAAISRLIPDAVTGYESELQLAGVDDSAIQHGGLYDAIIGNLDRHANNYMIDEGAEADQALHLIDNGLSFPLENTTRPGNADIYDRRVSRIGYGLQPEETKLLEDLVIHREEIDAELRANGLIGPPVDAMWERINYMLEVNEVSFGRGSDPRAAQLRADPRMRELDQPVLQETPGGGFEPEGLPPGSLHEDLGVPTANVRYLLQDIHAQGLRAEDLNKTDVMADLGAAGYSLAEIAEAQRLMLAGLD